MTRPVVHFEIHGKDGAKLQEFYGALFGWEIDANNPMECGMVSPGAGGPPEGIGGGITTSNVAPMVTFYIQVVSLEESLALAEHLGGKVVMQPMDVPEGPTIAQFADPEGNVIGLIKQ